MHLAVPVLERLLPALPAFGGLFLLAQDARLLIETPAANIREHAIPLYLLLETLPCTLKGLVLANRDVRHILPPSRRSEQLT